MKKLLLGAVIFMLCAVVSPAYAGDVDGLWFISNPDGSLNSLVMARENYGILLLTALDPGMNDWEALYGPFDGATGNLTTLVSLYEPISLSITLLSPDFARITITNCVQTVPEDCNNGTLIGTVLNAQKVF